MKVKDLQKQAADFVQERSAKDKEIRDRKQAAETKLQELAAQAERLAQERKFEEYADNMETQRKQKDIVDLANRISRRTPEQKAEDDRTAKEFYNKAQQVFTEDTAADFDELEKIIKNAEKVAQRITDKYTATNEAVQAVANACHSSVVYGTVAAPLSITGNVFGIIRQFENLHKAEKEGKKLC